MFVMLSFSEVKLWFERILKKKKKNDLRALIYNDSNYLEFSLVAQELPILHVIVLERKWEKRQELKVTHNQITNFLKHLRLFGA